MSTDGHSFQHLKAKVIISHRAGATGEIFAFLFPEIQERKFCQSNHIQIMEEQEWEGVVSQLLAGLTTFARYSVRMATRGSIEAARHAG